MNSNYLKLFWGLLVVLIDININDFDLFIDPIGYFIVLLGVQELRGDEEWFDKAFTPIIILFVVSFITLFVPSYGVVSITQGDFLSSALLFIYQVTHLYFAYCIFQGIIIMAIDENDEDLAERTEVLWRFYLWINVAMLLISTLAFIPLPFLTGMSFILVIAALIVEIAFLYIIFQAAKAFAYE